MDKRLVAVGFIGDILVLILLYSHPGGCGRFGVNTSRGYFIFR